MPISPARQTAYQILRRVESGRRFAVDLLQSSQVSRLRDADRRLTTELVMGVLRWRGELDFRIEQLSGKPPKYFDPEVATILRLAIYQVRFLQRIPKSAVVNEAVELTKAARKRSATGLVNAVLRKCAPSTRQEESGGADETRADRLQSAMRALPGWLCERWTRNFGLGAAQALALASNTVPPTTLRVESAAAREDLQRQIAEEGIETQTGRYSPLALVVRRGDVEASRVVTTAHTVIQDEASQLVGLLLAPKPGQRVLDLCAAPGIKTSQLALALGKGTLVACDLSARRLGTMARLLRERIPPSVHLYLVRLDAARQLPFACQFDMILLDVPCSGTGTLARNPEIKWRLQASDLPRLAVVQGNILRNALKVLGTGGRLVYATCSLEPEENEEVVERVLRENGRFRLLAADELLREFPSLASLFEARGFLRTRPDLHPMDGFFAAVIGRSG